MKVRVGELDRKAASVQRAVMMLDIAAGTIAVHALRPDHFAVAERLIGRYGSPALKLWTPYSSLLRWT